jgi:peptide deformylase
LRDRGLLARIAQHEIDHLDGILFVDRLPRWKRWLLRPRLLLVWLGHLTARGKYRK